MQIDPLQGRCHGLVQLCHCDVFGFVKTVMVKPATKPLLDVVFCELRNMCYTIRMHLL
jgi:hypothetical protein